MKQTLGSRLRISRENLGLSQKEAAKNIDVSSSVLSNYECDYRDPNTNNLRKLAILYDVSCDYLLGLTNVRRSLHDSNAFDTMCEKMILINIEKYDIIKKFQRDFLKN